MKTLLLAILTFSLPLSAQVRKLTPGELRTVAQNCAPGISVNTIFAIANTESSLYPNALSVNYPERAALRAGYQNAELSLSRQPRDAEEAHRWIHWLLAHGYTVSVGLMQINTETASTLGFTPDELIQPCTNIAVGSWILRHYFSDALKVYKTQPKALLAAFSAYNSGSYHRGFSNGYVGKVLLNARRARQLDLETLTNK